MDIKFKFNIGDKLHHKGYKINLIVWSRSICEDCDSTSILYETFIYIPGADECKNLSNVEEYWLEDGHRIE